MHTKRRVCYLTLLLAGAIPAVAPLKAQVDYRPARRAAAPFPARPRCLITDRHAEALLEADAAYLYRSDVVRADGAQSGAAGFFETRAIMRLAYFRWRLGDLDARADWRGSWITHSGDIAMPNQLMAVRAPLTWIGRHPDGRSTMLTVAPGYHGDGEHWSGAAVFVPATAAAVQNFSPRLAGIAGLEFRPGFERQWMPLFGAVWQPSSGARVDALLPRGGISLAAGRDWRLHAGYAWESIDYRLYDKRRQLNVEDMRLAAGVTRILHAELEITAEVGYVTERRLKYRRLKGGGRFDQEDSVFIRFAAATPF